MGAASRASDLAPPPGDAQDGTGVPHPVLDEQCGGAAGEVGEQVRGHQCATGEPGVDEFAVAGLQVVEGEDRLGAVEPALEARHPVVEPAAHVRTTTARVR